MSESRGDSLPPQLTDATVALAYTRWLEANNYQDTPANSWRFIAEVQGGGTTASAPVNRRALWLTIGLPVFLLVVLGVIALVAFTTAKTWTKVDAAEVGHYANVPTGSWEVSMKADVQLCFVGQNWWDCIDSYIGQWNGSCAERSLDSSSQALCDKYYAMIHEMQTQGGSNRRYEVVSLGTWGPLTKSEVTRRTWIVDEPAKTHQAACYLGFLGECA